MDNLPMIQNKLNIFQELRIRIYLALKYRSSRYKKSPDYIKQDERVLKEMIKGEQAISEIRNDELIELFMQKPYLFEDESRKSLINYAIKYRNFKIVKNLSDEEQYYLVKDRVYLDNKKILEYISIEVIKRLITEEYNISQNKKTNLVHDVTFGLKNNPSFYEPTFLKYCNPNGQLEIISENKKLIQYASIDIQIEYLKQHEKDLELANRDAKRKFLDGNIEFLKRNPPYVKKTSKETQLLFASQKKENLKYIEEIYQIELLMKYPTAIDYASKEVQKAVFDIEKFKKEFDKFHIKFPFSITNSLLGLNLKYFKNFNDFINNKIINNFIDSLDFEKMDDKTLINVFIKSGLFFAKGNLRSKAMSFYDEGQDVSYGKDIYNEEQLKTIQKLNYNQICSLIKTDANFIMPYVTGKKLPNWIDIDNLKECRQKCKDVFIAFYGEDKFTREIENSIDMIFDEQMKFQEDSGIKDLNGNNTIQFRIPLESLKVLFNEKIIQCNPPDEIEKYYQILFSEKQGKDEFRQIIQNAYGEKALKILDARKELDVYATNSLEVFDERITNNFNEEFVNDLISYNIEDFSAFLNIVKNEEELALFKEYYGILSETLGKNVETIQKAISEFYYNKEILQNIQGYELTEEQYTNLISVFCGEKNQFDIKNIDELNRYNEIAKENFLEKLEKAESVNDIKDCILENIFGTSYNTIFNTFDIYGLEPIKEIMNQEETEIFEQLNFIMKEEDSKKLKELSIELANNNGIINPISLYNGIQKIREKRIELLNKRMLTKEKLDELCDDDTYKNKVRKENIDGIEIYHFEGLSLQRLHLGFLGHADDLANGRNFMEAEGQSGMSTVSTRFYMDEDVLIRKCNSSQKPHLLFTKIESENLLAYEDKDANVDHRPKRVKASHFGQENHGPKIEKILKKPNNEVAFYRRTRNHDKRKGDKTNSDGRIKPDFILIYNEINKNDLEYAKKYKIPIIIMHVDRYNNREWER